MNSDPKSTTFPQGSAVIPSFHYKDAPAAIAWLQRAFGFETHAVYMGPGDTVHHAELRCGTGMIMLGSVRTEGPYADRKAIPSENGGRSTSGMYVVVPDCEAVWTSARAAGAEVVDGLREMNYGGRNFAVLDLEGYLWSFGEYDPWKPKEGVHASASASNGG